MIRICGIDLGYSHTKIVTADHRSIFPSAVGTPERARFGLGKDNHIILKMNGSREVLVGDGAVEQSRFDYRREDRNWIRSDEYRALLHTALTETSTATYEEVMLVTGLPLSYYSDKNDLRALLSGKHEVEREGRGNQTFDVKELRIIPQPFGSLFSLAFGPDGKVIRDELFWTLDEKGNKEPTVIGILDVGGHTVNMLATVAAQELVRDTTSISTGAWDVVRAVREYLHTTCRDLVINDHQLVSAIIKRCVNYYGERIDLGEVVSDSIAPLAQKVVAEASQLWDGGAGLHHILITGGGAKLVGAQIAEHFSRHKSVTVLADSVFANAVGYYRFGKYLERAK